MEGLLCAIALPFVGAFLLPLIFAPHSRRAGQAASVLVAVCLGLVACALPEHLHQPATFRLPWLELLGAGFAVRADGLSLLFALVITGVGFVVFSFAAAYLETSERTTRFFTYLLLFMGAMLGVVLAGDLISLFVFWELTSLTSFLLIGYWHPREASRAGALKALVVTSAGGLAMLVGFVMLGLEAGSFALDAVMAASDRIAASPWAVPATLLVIAGAITKSAQMPFHLWLPSAMEAPTPVSSYLHAATMVKAGLFLVARLGPVLAAVAIWEPVLATLGLVTMTWGSLLALRQRDLKGLLAFSTVSQLGLILVLLAPSEVEASAAGLLHLLNHSMFKGSLFLLVGVLEHEAHTRDLMRLGPLRTAMPRTWLLMAIAALSMAGVPPLGGFVSKELFLEHVLAMGPVPATVAVIGAVATAGYCFALILGLALGRNDVDPPVVHDPPTALLWGPALLVTGAIALGLAPQTLASGLVEAAAAAATGEPSPHLHLALWHGPTPALAASVFAVGSGLALFVLWWSRREPVAPVLLADRAYDAILAGLEKGARRITESYMSGLLWRYVGTITGVAMLGVLAVVGTYGGIELAPWPSRKAGSFELVAVAVTIAACLGTVMARTRLVAILVLGASGYALALLFALLGAPDLALTQIMVETIAVALFLAAFVYLPPYAPQVVHRHRPGHLLFSAVFGIGVALLVASARGARTLESIAGYFLDNSVELAGGRNVVNVILVDFRGLDTMGEITVLGAVALGAFAVIKMGPQRR
jgi:NADH:ubiquinone oxidoreductase subunit 5 (subunit L)/multisubunit Na+/H+ antiporter MnhA subunit